MRNQIKILAIALALISSTLWGVPLANAALSDGINYFATQQSANGSLGNTPASFATPIQSTAEVLRAYQTLGEQGQPPFNPALSFLNSDSELNTEFLARRIIVNAQAGNNVTALVNALLIHQNLDGSFGDQAGYDNSILDTAFALEAMTLAGVTDTNVIAPAVGFLLSRQQASGGWADGENGPSVYLTALAMRALWYYRHVYVGVPAALTNGKTFLFAQRDGAGRWGEDFNTALALLAILPTLPDLTSVSASIVALQAAQLPNGSWDNDAHTTVPLTWVLGVGRVSPSARRRRRT